MKAHSGEAKGAALRVKTQTGKIFREAMTLLFGHPVP